ncbi:MAG: 30S ribosomal protein S16 [bacterium]
MSVKIRLMRKGKKKFPFYRIVVTDSRSSLKGWFIEDMGSYRPVCPEGKQLDLDEQKVLSWLNKGAEPTSVVKNILKKTGILSRFNISKKKTVNPVKLQSKGD